MLERQFFKPQTAIVQIQIIGWLKSLLYICIDIFIYIYKQCPLKIKLVLFFFKVKTYKEHSDNGKQKKKQKYGLDWRAQLGSNWTWRRGEMTGVSNIYYGLQLIEDILCLYSSITYCHGAFTLKQVEGSEPNSFYKHYVQLVFLFLFVFSSFALRFRHCTSVIPHTPIYRAFKLTNSYLQIYIFG